MTAGRREAGGVDMISADDPAEISEEEFEAAKADVLRRWGAIPPGLQRVIDRGGRFGRVTNRGSGRQDVSSWRACYVYLLPGRTAVARTIEVNDSVMVDVDAEGRPVGIETLGEAGWQDALMTLAMRGRVRIT